MKLKLNNKYIDIIEAKSFKMRLYGLMGKTNIDYGMLFSECNSIHTFFMKEDIDDIKKTSILELPNNTSNCFNLGDKITF